ncbi:MAG: hypothetical protein L3J06_10710 [Cyclobacteriaceae bacterium]|nr:hypothetical protein [Cyclobacteriaceae bacterium]
MALGNNLKRIKKDSLIPAKKAKATKAKPKDASKQKATPKVVAKKKTSIKKVITPKVIPPSKSKKPIAKKTKIPTKILDSKQVANLNERIILGGKEGAVTTAKLIPSRRKTVRKTKLIFEGSLSLTEADAIKDCLVTTFTDYDIIDIQLQNITQLDIIPIQMIKLFINYYSDKKVKVDSDLPFDMKIIVERAGFGALMFKEEAA